MIPSVHSVPLSIRTLWKTGLALVLLLVGTAAGLAIRSVTATHGGSQTVHACVSLYTGQARIMRPGQPPNCTATETLVEWDGGDGSALISSAYFQSFMFGRPTSAPRSAMILPCNDINDVVVGGGYTLLQGSPGSTSPATAAQLDAFFVESSRPSPDNFVDDTHAWVVTAWNDTGVDMSVEVWVECIAIPGP